MGASLLLLWPLVKSSHRPAMLGGKIGQASAKPRRLPQHERGRDLIEPRILSKRIEDWIYAQLQGEPIRLRDHFRQPDKCVFEIAGACVGENIMRGRDILSASAPLVESLQFSPRQGSLGRFEPGSGKNLF